MTCKDCIHFDACEALFECFDVRLPYHENETCQKFKDKSKIIELPCKVGDTVYSYCECFGVILSYFVATLTIGYFDKKENYYTFEANCTKNLELLDCIDFDVDDIDKTVFLTREEAEKALKKMEEK